MYGIDKVIEELKGRSWGKFNVDWIENMLKARKAAPVEEVQVVEIEPIDVKEDGEAEAPELPTSEWDEVCPECGKSPCVCDSWEEKGNEDTTPAEEAAPEEEAWELETPSEEEKSRMDEILSAIKTFYPNENTEDVLVRMVQKLIDK